MQLFLLVAVIIYFLSPLDLLPDAFGPIGRIDDIALIAYALYIFRKQHSERSRDYYRAAQTDTAENTEERNYNSYEKPQHARKPSPYSVLGVSPTDEQGTIEKAYKDLARKYHPDKVAHLGEDLQKVANQRMAEITNAYQQVRVRRAS